MRERKDESNALQQRTVTDQAFMYLSRDCFYERRNSTVPAVAATALTEGTGDTHREHPFQCHQQCDFWNTMMAFPPLPCSN